MTTFVCAVGVNVYDDLPDLAFAADDARAIVEALTDRVSGTSTAEHSYLLVGQRGTRDEVARALGAIHAEATDDDLVVFYFAGHAVAYQGETYLMLHGDTNADLAADQLSRLSVSSVHRMLVTSRAQLSIMVVDACHVGDSEARIRQQQVDLSRSRARSNCIVLFGSSVQPEARETSALGHGEFTSRVLQHLREGPADSEGAIRVRSLLGLLPGELSFFNGSLTTNPILTRRVAPGTAIDLDPLHSGASAVPGTFGSPAHPLDGSAVWLERLVEAARSSADDAVATEHERWQEFLAKLCAQFGLSGAMVVEVTLRATVRYEHHLPSDTGGSPTVFKQDLMARLGRAFTEPEVWSRRRSAIRDVLILKGARTPVVVLPLGRRTTPSYLVLRMREDGTVCEQEAFAHALRATIESSKDFTRSHRDELFSHVLDELRRLTGFMPADLYDRRFELFRRDVATVGAVFQPIVASHTPHHVKGFEALARYAETRTPEALFKVADLWGRRFKAYFDLHMVDVALTAFARNGQAESGGWPFEISVNCFSDSLFSDRFAEAFGSILTNSRVPARQVILEISERASLSDELIDAGGKAGETSESLARYRDVLSEFTRRFNVRFGLDDFGVERANILRLTNLRLSYVKIDRAVLYSPSAEATFRYVSDVLRAQGDYPTIIAEGWEAGCKMTLDALSNLGCHYIQGFGLGRPNASIPAALADAREGYERHVAGSRS